MARVGHYYEITIPSYTLDEFKTHFRFSRDTFESTWERLSKVNAYNNRKGPTPNLEKKLLMFLWYIGNLESFRSMAENIGTSKGSFHSSITRVSFSLTSIMADQIIRWPTSQAELNETSQTFGENCQFQNVWVLWMADIFQSMPQNTSHRPTSTGRNFILLYFWRVAMLIWNLSMFGREIPEAHTMPQFCVCLICFKTAMERFLLALSYWVIQPFLYCSSL